VQAYLNLLIKEVALLNQVIVVIIQILLNLVVDQQD